MRIMQAETRRLPGVLDLLALHAANPRRYPYLLESAGGTGRLGRYDILCAFPGRELQLGPDGILKGQIPGERPTQDFLDALDQAWTAAAPLAAELPFQGGWFVFLAYELAGRIEPSVHQAADPWLPLARAVRIPAAVVRDRATGRVHAVAEADCRSLLDEISADAAQSTALPESLPEVARASLPREEDPRKFLAAVTRAKDHIAAGDIYQANLSRRWTVEVDPGIPPWMIYGRLRQANPAPFAGLALLDDATAIISSSPERLVRVHGGRVETRPIAGTRPRTAMSADAGDAAVRAALLGSAKERAEHVMLIDLERSDLGRVCQPGTVRVEDFMSVESYAHVHHIVSGVTGDLRHGTTPGSVLRAVFPGGTITGCPKVRCMQLIGELESAPRGAYTGAMGYLNHDGSCDFSILIRTMVLNGRRLSFNAGSGIVADSDPELELAETRAKAKGMILALSNP